MRNHRHKLYTLAATACLLLIACEANQNQAPDPCAGPIGSVRVQVWQPHGGGGNPPARGVRLELVPDQVSTCDVVQGATTDASGVANLSGRTSVGWKLHIYPPDSLMLAATQQNPVAVPLASSPATVQVMLHFAPRDTMLTFYVASERVSCQGNGLQSCLQVKTRPDNPYELFYGAIEGFTFEAGYEYVLRVIRRRVPMPAADQGIYSYHLVEVVSRSTPGSAPSATMSGMLSQVPARITSALKQNQDLLPRNQHLAAQIQAKTAILSQPNLASDIVGLRYYAETSTVSIDGGVRPIVTVFIADTMRAGATAAIEKLKSELIVLETFMGTAFPIQNVRMWYGFTLGNSGGGGVLNMEDRGTYEGRTPATRLPFDAILYHELAHSYIGNESLTQFIELYVYNVVRTRSTNAQDWVHTRSWVRGSSTNSGVHALLDIYEMIGQAAMSAAYKAIYPLRPPYGVVLSAEAQQAFVDHAPAAVRSAVAAKAAMIGQ